MLAFRVNANEHIATGHLMRCMAIALEWIRQGEKCIFILSDKDEVYRLEEKNIDYVLINSKWNELDREVSELEKIINKYNIDKLVIDSYEISEEYLSCVNNIVPVLYIDDMLLNKYDVTAVLHYSEWGDDKELQNLYQNSKNILLMAGMSYVPLRVEFANIDLNNVKREQSILITTGGTDPYNITNRVLEECREKLPSYIFHVIIGSMNKNEQIIQNYAKRYEKNIIIHKNINNMSEYMKKCEIAISAGGSTLFEMCACGIPTICFSFADNQEKFVKELGKRNIMIYAGDARKNKNIEKTIFKQLKDLTNDDKKRKMYSSKMIKLVDGKGVERIIDRLKNFNEIY